MLLQPKSFEEPESVLCRSMNKRLTIFRCMANYVDANALRQKDNPCYDCAQGAKVRAKYSGS